MEQAVSQGHRCPRCTSTEIARSRRRVWERLLFFLKPYRCTICDHRYFVLNIPTFPDASL
jgi:predicted Zn-ribbon and HTH transcriptional regulator